MNTRIAHGHLVPIDCFPEVIELAARTNRWCRFQTIAPTPPTTIASESCSLVYLYSVFSHLSEDAHLQWLGEFSRILRRGGLVVATTRPRSFIRHCADLRAISKVAAQREGTTSSVIDAHHEGLAASFLNTDAALADYDRGVFCFEPTGGGGVLSPSFYGEACISETYVRKNWLSDFELVAFSERPGRHIGQNVIVVRKK
jgi:hypothetical protein